jgi:hypothetical protein
MSKQTRKILNEDTIQSYNKANSKLLNIIKKKVANDGKSTNLFSQLNQYSTFHYFVSDVID